MIFLSDETVAIELIYQGGKKHKAKIQLNVNVHNST